MKKKEGGGIGGGGWGRGWDGGGGRKGNSKTLSDAKAKNGNFDYLLYSPKRFLRCIAATRCSKILSSFDCLPYV